MKNIFTLGAAHPAIDESAFIAPPAVLIGDVSVGARSSVWFNCVLRGDTNSIRIGAGSNIQDGTIVHVDPGAASTEIGDDVTIGHGCIIHGCKLMDRAFVGMGATILNDSVIESGGVLAACGLLTAGKRIASQELWGGMPAKLLRVLSAAEVTEFSDVAQHYVRNAARFRADCKIH